MYKIVNLAGRISLFFVIQVAMYYAMFDPLLRICFDLPINRALVVIENGENRIVDDGGDNQERPRCDEHQWVVHVK